MAAPDAQLDYSAKAEMALIDRGLPYLHEVMHSRHWRVYAGGRRDPDRPGAGDPAGAGARLADARPRTGPGSLLVHVRFTPYWALSGAAGCVAPDGQYTRVTLRAPGTVRLVTQFALGPDRGTLATLQLAADVAALT